MPDSSTLADDVQLVIDESLATLRGEYLPISTEVRALLDHAESFTRGGKRIRASFCAAGYRSVRGATAAHDRVVVLAAAALELFHAAALVHDDIIDRSDLRRGAPASHRAFALHHERSGWAGSATHFGQSAAILFGDLLLMLSDDLFVEASLAAPTPEAGAAARREISRMRTEVTVGQYLDIVEEVAWPVVPVSDREARALTIATSKSARYSIEEPLVIGARLAGASEEQVKAIRAIGLPLGLAFQLRDDVLGVFGDAKVTGKPAGDDLREGKRTLLIAATEKRVDDAEREWFDSKLGDPDLSATDIATMQARIREVGALDEVESRIAAYLDEALAAIDRAALDAESTELLRDLAHRTARREY